MGGVENLGPWDHGVQTHSDHGTMKREGGGGVLVAYGWIFTVGWERLTGY